MKILSRMIGRLIGLRRIAALVLIPLPARLRSRLRAVTMPEAVLVVSIGALLVVGAVTVGVNVMNRVQASARVEELVVIVESVWDRYQNASEYTALSAASVAGTLPERMTNDAKNRIFLGGGILPIYLYTGQTIGAPIGASAAQTFFLAVGNADFPVKSSLICERILGRWDDQDERLFGFQVSPCCRHQHSCAHERGRSGSR